MKQSPGATRWGGTANRPEPKNVKTLSRALNAPESVVKTHLVPARAKFHCGARWHRRELQFPPRFLDFCS